MMKPFFSLALFCLVAVGLPAQVRSTLAADAVAGPVKAGEKLSARLTVAIEPGWHIASITQADGGPVRTEIALADKKDRVRSQYANLALAMCDGFDKDCRRFFTETLDGTPQKDMASALAISASLGNLGMAAPALTQWVGDAGVDSKARGYAAMAMGILGQRQGDDVAKALRDAYAKDEDANLRRGVVLGLGFVGDRDDVPFLLDVIAKADSQALSRYTRGSAATALGMIRDGESIARIAGLMSRPDPITRAYAIAALGCVGDKDPVPAMTKLFENCNFRRTFPTLDVVKRHL